MKSKYDGTWVWIPRGPTESMLLLEWLAENGHTLGRMVIVVSDKMDGDENVYFKIHFEFPNKELIKNLTRYINDNN